MTLSRHVHRIGSLFFVRALALGAICFISREAVAVDKQTLLKAFEDRERALQTFSVQLDLSTLRYPDRRDRVELKSHQVVVIRNGQVRCTARQEEIGTDGKIVETLSVGIFDGNKVHMVKGVTERWTSGWVSRDLAPFPWDIPVTAYVTHYDNKPLSLWASSRDFRILGEEDRNGRRVVIAECGPFPLAENHTKAVWEFSLTDALALRRASAMIRFSGKSEWLEYSSLDVSDFTTDSNSGIVLPAHCRRQVTQILNAASAPELVFDISVVLTHWNLSPTIKDDLFSLEFPRNVVVNDMITGQTYVATTIGDEDLRRMIAQAAEKRPPHVGRLFYIVACCAIAVVSIAIFAWARAARARS